MPMTLADAEREITALKALVVGLQRSNGTLTNRIAALEQQGTVVQSLSRLIDGVNQYGSLHASLLQNQTVSNEPARPWRPV